MALHRISLMDAYLIETLRSNGISNEEIITQIKQENIEAWKRLNKHFDFNELIKLAKQDMDAFQTLLSLGYRVKFVTFKGLQNLLRLRFGKENGKDYELTETGIRQLTLNHDQLVSVKKMLSENWVAEEIERDNEVIVNIVTQ